MEFIPPVRSTTEENAQLVCSLWAAALTPSDAELFSSLSQPHHLDLGQALRLVQQHTLSNQLASLNDLATLLLGLSRMVTFKCQMLGNVASLQQNTEALVLGYAQATSTCNAEHRLQSDKTNLREKEEELKSRPIKRKKLDRSIELTKMAAQEEMEDTLDKMIPDLGPVTRHQMRLYRESVHLMKRPVRGLSAKLAYLFARNANVNKSRDKERALTCDSSSGKRARMASGVRDCHHLSVLSGSLSVLPYQRRPAEMTLLAASQHYLPVPCRHLLVNTREDNAGDARATVPSIKSIMFGYRSHSSSEECAHSEMIEVALQDLLARLGGTSSAQDLIHHAASHGSGLTKQVAAAHLMALLRLASRGAVQLSQASTSALHASHMPILCCLSRQ